MSKTLKEADYIPQKPVKSIDDGDTEDESETAHSPSDSSNSDNDTDVPAQAAQTKEPTCRLGSVTAQLSFRKIAKKRRKAGGRSSFHHTKSSKEYLRKAQEAYQRLKISEQEQTKDQYRQPEVESGRDKVVNDMTTSSIKTKDPEAIDYGNGDPTDKKTKDEVDYGYGDPSDSKLDQDVDYGYGDAAGGQPQLSRRGGKPRRRNSVTKYSAQAANVVRAQAAAERILKLKPSLTSLSRSSTTPTRRRQQQDQAQQLNNVKQVYDPRRDVRARRTGNVATMQTTLQRQHQQQVEDNENQITDWMAVDRVEPPQRSSHSRRSISGDRGSVIQSQRLQVTSDYFSSDPKPKNLVQRNTGRVNGTTFRFTTPARTSSWLSNDNSYSTMNKTDDDDDDDCDSLASDMESLCSIRDTSYRLDTHHNSNSLKNTDMAPVLPSSDRRSRFASGRNISGEMVRKPLVVSWSNGSNKDGALSRFGIDKSRPRRERSGSNDFAILPSARFAATNGSKSKSCMPAPVRRTPSYKGPQQRQD
jgi:hypothetical protein